MPSCEVQLQRQKVCFLNERQALYRRPERKAEKAVTKRERVFWTLCGKLASALGIPSHEIYRQYVKEIGDNFETIPIKNEAKERFIQPGNLMVLAFYVKNWRKPRPDIPRLRPIMVLQPTIPGKCQISLIWWFSTARNRGLKHLLPMN